MKKTDLSILLVLFFTPILLSAQAIQAVDLRCEYKENPVAIDVTTPRLSWKMQAPDGDRSVLQTAYQVRVAGSADDLAKGRRLLWDSGQQMSDQTTQIPYQGPALQSRQLCYWQVRIWDNQGRESEWSPVASWEMGLLNAREWTAQWIEPDWEEKEKAYNPVPMLRKTFTLKKNIAKARLYVTAHGLYEAFFNGQRVGDELFTPGWTAYQERLQYQTYDVTDLLQAGDNAVGVLLGDGWYRGQFGFQNNWNIYGKKTALLFQLEVTYKNGKKDIIVSDESWKGDTGPILMSSLYDGEVQDTRLEKKGWTATGYDDSDWQKVIAVAHSKDILVAPEGVPVRRMEELPTQQIITTPKGEIVADLGQNMVGWVKLKVKGQPGDVITLHHAEVLDKEGNFYTDNLRSAQQKVQYILSDDQEHVFEPHFSFQGFRYVRIEGLRGPLTEGHITGVVIYSDMEKTGSFECSNPLVNQLQSNIEWGQKGNFLDVPTDCPQRDERMGWTGDAQAFASTACFNFNTAAFYTKWLQDLKADQLENGSVPHVIPHVLGANAHGSTGWADAATIVPWTMYLKYDDTRILERQYESMKAWVGYLEMMSEGNFLVQKGFHFGDWLFFIHPTEWNVKPGHTDIDFLATAFFAYSTQLTLQTARILGKTADIDRYEKLHESIKKAFQGEFLTPSGRLSPHSQTAYTLALAFDLLPEEQRQNAADYLVKDIKARDYHLSTGFLGTPHLCHVLSENGHADVAYKLLFQDTYPSWLYPVTRGATTIWERWDGIKPDSTFQTTRMNSFNHYAYGAIGDWMYRVAAGIEVDPKNPGYKHVLIQPHPTRELDYARADHHSLHGEIISGWKWNRDQIQVEVRIPANTTATVLLPGAKLAEVKEGDQALNTVKGVKDLQQEGDNVRFELGSGNYLFQYPVKR